VSCLVIERSGTKIRVDSIMEGENGIVESELKIIEIKYQILSVTIVIMPAGFRTRDSSPKKS
jgi:hypothetical protein